MISKIELITATLAAISVVLIIIDYVYQLSNEQKYFIYIFDLGIVAVLIADFCRRLRASGEGYRHFLLKHWYEIPAMLPVVLFALIETHTVIGAAIRGIRLIRLFRIVHLFFRTTRIIQESKIAYLIALSSGSVILGALAEYTVESPSPDSKITNLSDALWWAIVTVTTVGYGDVYPVTLEGRIIASILMIIGIGVLGIFISTFGAALIESRIKRTRQEEEGSSNIRDHKKKSSSDSEKPHSESNTANSISKGTTSINQETKSLIKSKIDEIEEINEKETKLLIDMIEVIRASHNARNDDGNREAYAKTDM